MVAAFLAHGEYHSLCSIRVPVVLLVKFVSNVNGSRENGAPCRLKCGYLSALSPLLTVNDPFAAVSILLSATIDVVESCKNAKTSN